MQDNREKIRRCIQKSGNGTTSDEDIKLNLNPRNFLEPLEQDLEFREKRFKKIRDIEYSEDHMLIKRVGLYEISVCDEPSDRNARLSDTDLRNIETEEDLKKYLKRFNLDDAMADQLIQRVQTLNKPPEPKVSPLSSLDWVK